MKQRKYNAEGGSSQELFDALMIVDPLHDIARDFYIKKGHGQPHELDKKVWYQWYVDTAAYMQKQPASDDLNSDTA